MVNFDKSISDLLKVAPIKQVAIIDLGGNMIAKSDRFEVDDSEFEPFQCLFDYNTQIEARQIQLNMKKYDITFTKHDFLYGKCGGQGLMVVKTNTMFIIIFIQDGKEEFATARKALGVLSASLRTISL